jgi:hypothetical protein
LYRESDSPAIYNENTRKEFASQRYKSNLPTANDGRRQSKQNVVFKREGAELNRHESHASECFNGCTNDLTSTGKTSTKEHQTIKKPRKIHVLSIHRLRLERWIITGKATKLGAIKEKHNKI